MKSYNQPWLWSANRVKQRRNARESGGVRKGVVIFLAIKIKQGKERREDSKRVCEGQGNKVELEVPVGAAHCWT